MCLLQRCVICVSFTKIAITRNVHYYKDYETRDNIDVTRVQTMRGAREICGAKL